MWYLPLLTHFFQLNHNSRKNVKYEEKWFTICHSGMQARLVTIIRVFHLKNFSDMLKFKSRIWRSYCSCTFKIVQKNFISKLIFWKIHCISVLTGWKRIKRAALLVKKEKSDVWLFKYFPSLFTKIARMNSTHSFWGAHEGMPNIVSGKFNISKYTWTSLNRLHLTQSRKGFLTKATSAQIPKAKSMVCNELFGASMEKLVD